MIVTVKFSLFSQGSLFPYILQCNHGILSIFQRIYLQRPLREILQSHNSKAR